MNNIQVTPPTLYKDWLNYDAITKEGPTCVCGRYWNNVLSIVSALVLGCAPNSVCILNVPREVRSQSFSHFRWPLWSCDTKQWAMYACTCMNLHSRQFYYLVRFRSCLLEFFTKFAEWTLVGELASRTTRSTQPRHLISSAHYEQRAGVSAQLVRILVDCVLARGRPITWRIRVGKGTQLPFLHGIRAARVRDRTPRCLSWNFWPWSELQWSVMKREDNCSRFVKMNGRVTRSSATTKVPLDCGRNVSNLVT